MSTVISDADTIRNIAANIRQLLKEHEWSQGELARRSGESAMTISHVVNGKHMPSAAIIARIAEAFQVPADILLTNPRKKTSRSA